MKVTYKEKALTELISQGFFYSSSITSVGLFLNFFLYSISCQPSMCSTSIIQLESTLICLHSFSYSKYSLLFALIRLSFAFCWLFTTEPSIRFSTAGKCRSGRSNRDRVDSSNRYRAAPTHPYGRNADRNTASDAVSTFHA